MQVWKQTGKRPAKLDAVSLPDAVAHVWEWFVSLHGQRGGGPLSHTEIAAWAALEGIRPSAFEVRLLRAFDAAFLRFRSTGE